MLAEDFKRRLVDAALAPTSETLSSPRQMAEHARDQPLDALNGEPLGGRCCVIRPGMRSSLLAQRHRDRQ